MAKKRRNNKRRIVKKKFPDPSDARRFYIFLAIISAWFLFSLISYQVRNLAKELDYVAFYNIVKNNKENPIIANVIKEGKFIKGEFTLEGQNNVGDGKYRYFKVYLPEEDTDIITLMRENIPEVRVIPPKTFFTNFLFSFAPVIILILFFWYLSYKGNQMGSRVWSFGRARALLVEKDKAPRVTFNDVAGVDEAKEELQEVVDFLRDPRRFQRLGGRFPKGILLVGPPGCGKTLLAKAVAGEAGVPFFSISGSDFVEMFVGVGAARVRDLFDQAKKAAKIENKGCIIFIDEIDAVGRQRFAGLGGGHDEREQTLNQLLTEMDGFQTNTGIIVMAATNRPDVLDLALLRPGRFDRHIVVYLPDIKGREEILKVHIRKIKLADDVSLRVIAERTPGFSGADLENLCNEAALLAARRNKDVVTQQELEEAIERVVMGPEKKSRVISPKEKKITAYHEAGHALLSLLISEVAPMAKVSIIPRGMAEGYTFAPPREDKRNVSKRELLGDITVLLGGRAAEELWFGDITTGAMNDLNNVTSIARKMVCDYGMSEKLGPFTLGKRHGPIFLGRDIVSEKDYSEETAKIIDEEVKHIVDTCYEKAKQLLKDNKEKLEAIVKALLEKEVLNEKEVREIIALGKDTSEC